ncbi:MAG TPA: energy-coupled thiamine transporter ThiT, partial [Clostridia bacterium]|nr:energy-coupled thiamine transporter ThiT [Clostridia bacterium]
LKSLYMLLGLGTLGGSVTLCSMLPVVLFGYLYGPAYGFTAAFAYSLLQIAQGPYVVHPVQFALDYLFAFTALGLGSLFPKNLPLGMAVSGLARVACSVISGVVFFAEYAAEAGYQSALWYSLAYNGSTVGVETALCVLVALLPPVKRAIGQIKRT